MAVKSTTRRRADAVRRLLKPHRLDALLVTHRPSVRYLTGFTGTAGAVLVSREALHLIVDFRYFEQAALEAPEAELVHVEAAHYDRAIAEAARLAGVTSLAFEADHTSFAEHMALESALPGVVLVPSRGLVAQGREVKDLDEIGLIRQAASITAAAMTAVAATLAAGQSEREVAMELERQMKRLGGGPVAFEPLVAFGERAALPHPQPGSRALAPGDWVLVDAGTTVAGYCADMTRSFVFGRMRERQSTVYAAVERALAAGLDAVRPGAAACEVDAACRRVLTEAGFGGHFGASAGHGVGLEVHEGPRLAPDAEDVLEPGMVVTVEPGVYLPGWGGCRLEQLVLVTPTGCEVLTAAPLDMGRLCTLAH